MRRTASVAPELPGFVYQRLLGAGGFSDVFLYQQDLPRRQVAVKVLLAEELTPAARKAFVDEANLMAQLSAHPFIVTIYGADVAEGDRPYFVMEYCAGPSLSERYKRERFSAEDALRTGVRLASAIATAHAAGILHRDIKPANVLTNDYGWPALTDFGISSAVDEMPAMTTTTGSLRRDGDTSGGTESQSVGLSVPWSPPEMFADDPRPDVRSDVFSLAATIWTLLAGRTPFELPGRGNGALDLIGRIERGRITPMDRPDVPRSLIAVLQKGMAPRREDRWQTAVEFARALQRVELELGYASTTIDVPALAHEAAPPAAEGADAEETRMRSVATIDAQPVAPATRPPAEADDRTRIRGLAQPSAPDDGTVLRTVRPARPAASAPPVLVEPQGRPSSDASADSAPEARDRRRLLTILAAAGTAAVVAVVVVALAVTGGGATDPDPGPTASGGSALGGDAVPRPRFLTATPSADGTAVTFQFRAVEGADAYSWAPSEQPDATQQIATPTVVRTGVTPGGRVCVDVLAIRAGRTSESTEACFPP